MFMFSFRPYDPMAIGGVGDNKFTLENYEAFLIYGRGLQFILVTVRITVISTIATVVLAYPVSYYTVRSRSRLKNYVITLLILSVLTSFIVRLYALMLILGTNGVLERSLALLGIPHVVLFGSEAAVIIALVNANLSLAVLIMIGSIANIDPNLENAAKNLGASGIQTFVKITLPLSLPGITAVTFLSFAMCMAAFVTPMFLGAGRVTMVANLVYTRFISTLNYPLGSAMAAILTTISLALVLLIGRLLSKLNPARGGEK